MAKSTKSIQKKTTKTTKSLQMSSRPSMKKMDKFMVTSVSNNRSTSSRGRKVLAKKTTKK